MEQLFFIEQGLVEWRDNRLPGLVDGEEALVRPVAVATCDVDTDSSTARAVPRPVPARS
jgi:hypothetical protein